MKTTKQLERHFKGIANHRRIAILMLIAHRPNMTLEEIAEYLRCNFKTISEHTRRLVAAGLVNKTYRGREVMHAPTPYGEKINKILTTF
jgi:DNA-binding MarR family transcriptional regulator